MLTLGVNELFSDWYHVVEYTIDETKYNKFRLIAIGNDIVWHLQGFNEKGLQFSWQIEYPSPATLIKILSIKEIVGNQYLDKERLVK